MYTIKERIAISRIVSDIIKADNIIEESEIEMLNRFRHKYDLDNRIMSEGRRMKFSTAVMDLNTLTEQEKLELFNNLKTMAMSDGACVPREALLLLALSYSFGFVSNEINKDMSENRIKSRLISCPTGDVSINSQYVIYIEGKYDDTVNNDIRDHLENNVLILRLWGFDFVYIPALVTEFGSMNKTYVKDVVKFMAPELSDATVDVVYDRLLNMDTVKFCNKVLAGNLGVNDVRNSEPSLFINIGTSVIPYCSASGPVECYTEFLCIPITKDISSLVRSFVRAYSELISYYAVPNVKYAVDWSKNFKYFGFYKAMFDFLVKAEPKDSDMVLYVYNNLIDFPQVSYEKLMLTPQESALYKLIIYMTYNHTLGGLPTTYNAKYNNEIVNIYTKIYRRRDAELPANMAPIRSRIESKLKKNLPMLANIDDYIPRLKDGKYVITARPERIKIKQVKSDSARLFIEHNW